MLCELFGYTKQAYYKQFSNQTERCLLNEELTASVLTIRRQMPRLGTRKLHHLIKGNYPIGRDKLFNVLRKEGLLIFKRKKYTKTTNSKHWMRKYPNQVKELILFRPEQLWVADITHVETLEGNAYLHLVTDAYSKKIMGYELCANMEAVSTVKALNMAIKNRQYKNEPLMHHSDRGLQYCSKIHIQSLTESGISVSMTESGSPYDNAIAERINGILKDEFGLGERFTDLKEAQMQTRESIAIYNSLRPHLSCSMLTPNQMHNQQNVKLKTYKKTSNILVDV